MNSLLARVVAFRFGPGDLQRVLQRDRLRDVAGDDDRGDRWLVAVVERLTSRLDGDPVPVVVADSKARGGRAALVEDPADRGDDDGLVVVVHELERRVADAMLLGDAVHLSRSPD